MHIFNYMLENESKSARFKRLAESRTNAVLEKIKILGNCSNRSMYAYTDEEINKIFSEIDKYLKETKAQFRPSRAKRFSL